MTKISLLKSHIGMADAFYERLIASWSHSNPTNASFSLSNYFVDEWTFTMHKLNAMVRGFIALFIHILSSTINLFCLFKLYLLLNLNYIVQTLEIQRTLSFLAHNNEIFKFYFKSNYSIFFFKIDTRSSPKKNNF